MAKLKFKSYIFKSIFYNFFINTFYIFFIYIKMCKHLSAKYYSENQERLQKRALERYQSLS